MSYLKLLVVGALVLSPQGKAFGETCADYTVGTHFLNRTEAPVIVGHAGHDVRTVRTQYPYLYAAGGAANSGALGAYFEIQDISDPAAPSHLASLTGVVRYTSDFVLVGDHAFLVGDYFSSVDISDPSNPQEVASMPWSLGSGRITYCEELGLVFCAARDSGLVCVDVSNPLQPSILSVAPELLGDSSYFRSIEVNYPYIYAGLDSPPRFAIYDVSDPLDPVEVNSWFEPTYSLQLEGDHLYAAGAGAGFRIYDLSDPALPAVVGSVPGITATDLWVDGGLAYVNVDGWIDVYDVADPASPQKLRSTGIEHRSVWNQMDGAKGYLFGGGGSHNYARGVAVALIGTDTTPPVDPVSSLGPLGRVYDMDVYGDRLLLIAFHGTTHQRTLQMLDYADPTSPSLLGELGLAPFQATSLVSNDSMAFVAGPDEIHVVDLRDPSSLSVHSTFPLDFTPSDLGLSGSHLVLGLPTIEGIRIYDVSDPASITEVGSALLPAEGYVGELWVEGDDVYLSWITEDYLIPSGIAVLNISDPTAPDHISTIELESRGRELVVHQNTLWATYGGNYDRYRLAGYDVSSPANPVNIRNVGMPRFTESLVAMGSHLYGGTDKSGVLVVDIADPASALPIGNIDTEFTYVGRMAAISGHLAAGSTINSSPSEHRVRVYSPQCNVTTSVPVPRPDFRSLELSAKPNPFNPSVNVYFELTESTTATLEVYDLQGRRIRRLSSGLLQFGPQVVAWDGRDDAGRAVSSGAYIVRVKTPSEAGLTKVTLLK